jgi:Tfp pilus assembly protein PilP
MRTLTFVLVAPIALSMMSTMSTALSAQTPASKQPQSAQKPAAPPPAASAPQTPAPQSAPPPAEKPATPPPPQETYSYQPQGRRDPFINLLGTGTEPRTAGAGKRGDGPAGMTTAEISVRGILQSRGALVAMITGPDGKTYVVHQGDKLQDGTIKSITPQGLIVIQEVNDPLSLVKQREVTKLLRALEVAKE